MIKKQPKIDEKWMKIEMAGKKQKQKEKVIKRYYDHWIISLELSFNVFEPYKIRMTSQVPKKW